MAEVILIIFERKFNSMYEKVSTDLNLVQREKQVEKFWKDHDIFKKSMKLREGCPTYTFYDGPPTANGKPHIGHVLTPCNQGYDSAIQNNERLYGSS